MTDAGAASRAPRSSLGLPRGRRLRRHNDFTRLERSGARVHGALVSLIARPGRGRVGFTVSKKVALKATTRNTVKRRLREVLRAEPAWWRGLDLVVVAKPEAVGKSLEELRDDVVRTRTGLEKALAAVRDQVAPRGGKARGGPGHRSGRGPHDGARGPIDAGSGGRTTHGKADGESESKPARSTRTDASRDTRTGTGPDRNTDTDTNADTNTDTEGENGDGNEAPRPRR